MESKKTIKDFPCGGIICTSQILSSDSALSTVITWMDILFLWNVFIFLVSVYVYQEVRLLQWLRSSIGWAKAVMNVNEMLQPCAFLWNIIMPAEAVFRKLFLSNLFFFYYYYVLPVDIL